MSTYTTVGGTALSLPLNGTGFEGRHGNASGIVAPHGIIGQTWDGDGIAVDGAQDDYEHSGVEV